MKELMLKKQVDKRSVMFATTGIFKGFSDIAILSFDGGDYHCIISRISKCEAVNLLQKADVSIIKQ